MIQQRIKFFWPLTEQLELDLDFSNCVKTEENTCTLNKKPFIINGIELKTFTALHERLNDSI